MARQNRRETVHYDDGFGPVCPVAGADSATTTDPRQVYCTRCERMPAWREAWDAARRTG
ncbi:MAG TPA: hypothetical protein VIQ30_17900 [Pseudonocardia sp.]